ncbi:MAG: arylesterase [Gammaproteobacteria bacterium]|nr:arylesterase [Gammaproteobacteria bacterium]
MKNLFPFMLLFMTLHSHAEPPVILVLGDSLSAGYGIDRDAGWVNLLQNRLNEQNYSHRVINASISGDTTANGLARLPLALERFSPSIIIIELGGNDGLRGLRLDQSRHNLSQMIDLAQAADCRVLLLGMMLPPNFGRSDTQKFLQIYQDLAAERSLPLVPFFLEGVVNRPEWMQMDSLHPKAEAQPRMLENVWVVLQPIL